MMLRATLIAVLALAVLAACAAPTQIDGHKIRASAASADDLHQGAPAWFTALWGDYLRHARGGYAVLALDRNGQGGWYVHCATAGCHILDSIWVRSVRDVHYTYPALEHCRDGIAKTVPAIGPDCALYAIKDKIVWQGPLPWEDANARPERPAIVGATPDFSGPSFALDMLEFWRLKWQAE